MHRKANCIGHILKRNWFLYDINEGYMTVVKGVGKINTIPWWFEEQKMIPGARGRSWRSRKKETTVYHKNIKKKYKLSSISPWIYQQSP